MKSHRVIRHALSAVLALGMTRTALAPPAFALPNAASPTSRLLAAPTCTRSVPPEVDVVDGERDFADVGPGEVICIPAGKRGNLKLRNLHGAPGRPILVRNDGGQVLIGGTRFLDGAIILSDSSDLRLSGAGVEQHCGAEFPAADQRCGIEIDGANKGIKIDTGEGHTGNIEIDHVGVLRISQENKTRGILIHPLPRQVISGIHINHNYIANTQAEGIYVGSEPHGQPLEALAKVTDVDVSYNRVEHTGYDGIKVKVGIRQVAVHHNVIQDAGLLHDDAHQGGIKLALSVGDYYNNTVIGAAEGIRMGRHLDAPHTRYFNNVVVNVSEVGIDDPGNGAQIFNNTVVQSQKVGISANGKRSRVTDNIIADAGQPLIVGKDATADRNLIGPVATIGFHDPAIGDYRLGPTSKAIEAGPRVGRFTCSTTDIRFPKRPSRAVIRVDHQGHPRPSGCHIDLGAYEHSRPIP